MQGRAMCESSQGWRSKRAPFTASRKAAAVLVAMVASSTAARAQGPAPPDAQVAGPNSGGSVFVELRTTSPDVRIERVAGASRVPVCSAPCRQVLPSSEVYVIGGPGVTSSRQFTLPADHPRVVLDVTPGSKAAASGGLALAVTGGVVLAVGYVALVLGSAADQFGSAFDGKKPSGDSTTPAIVIGVAGVSMVLGGVLLILSARTKVQSSTGASFSESPARPPRRPLFALTPRGLEF